MSDLASVLATLVFLVVLAVVARSPAWGARRDAPPGGALRRGLELGDRLSIDKLPALTGGELHTERLPPWLRHVGRQIRAERSTGGSRHVVVDRDALLHADGDQDADGEQAVDAVVRDAKPLLQELCRRYEIPESHGFGHADRVLAHVDAALKAAPRRLTGRRRLAVRLAALLHDADDRKYFPDGPDSGYANARRIATQAGAPADVADEISYMIGLVSTSSNGNAVPERAVAEPEVLWPRWADRLEAIGERGVVRCWQYGDEVGRLPFDDDTPRPSSEEKVWALATLDKFEAYTVKKVKSRTSLDHVYSVLLSVARPPVEALQNPYFEAAFARGREPLVRVCLELGATGGVDAERIRAMGERLDREGRL